MATAARIITIPGGQLEMAKDIDSLIVIILLPHNDQPQPFAQLNDEQKGKKSIDGRKNRKIFGRNLTMPMNDKFQNDKADGNDDKHQRKPAAKAF